MMDFADHAAAVEALICWFESQGITPADASSCMIDLIAMQLTLKTKDLNQLQVAANATRDLLVLDIASYLRT